MGTFKWINIPNRETNLLGEIGFMFARFNCAPEPGDQVDNAIVLLHRRESAIPITYAKSSSDEGTATTDIAIEMQSKVVYWDDDETESAYTGIEVLLADEPNVQLGDEVKVTTTGGSVNFTDEAFVVVRDYTNGRLGLRLKTLANAADIQSILEDATTAVLSKA